MKRGQQTILARKTGLSNGYISQILRGLRRPAWRTAKKLSESTNTEPVLWLEGSPEQMKAIVRSLHYQVQPAAPAELCEVKL